MDEHCHAVAGHPNIYTCKNGASVYKTNNSGTPYVILNANQDELLQCSIPHPSARVGSGHAYTCRSVAPASDVAPFARVNVYGLATNFSDTVLTLAGHDGTRTMVLHPNTNPAESQ